MSKLSPHLSLSMLISSMSPVSLTWTHIFRCSGFAFFSRGAGDADYNAIKQVKRIFTFLIFSARSYLERCGCSLGFEIIGKFLGLDDSTRSAGWSRWSSSRCLLCRCLRCLMFHGRGRRWDGGFGGFFLGRRGSGSGSVLSFPEKNNICRNFAIKVLVVNNCMHFEWIQRDAGLLRLCTIVNTRPAKWMHMKRRERFDVHTMALYLLFVLLAEAAAFFGVSSMVSAASSSSSLFSVSCSVSSFLAAGVCGTCIEFIKALYPHDVIIASLLSMPPSIFFKYVTVYYYRKFFSFSVD